jgi:hypothetical protein
VIIFEIHVKGFAFLESERDPPIGSHCDRPLSLAAAFERVKVEARHVHAFDGSRRFERDQDGPKAFKGIGIEPARIAGLRKAL